MNQAFAKVYFLKNGKVEATRRVLVNQGMNLEAFKAALKKFFNIGEQPLTLQYLDNENDWIDFSEEDEWTSILVEQCQPSIATTPQKVFKINVILKTSDETQNSTFASSSSSTGPNHTPINVFRNKDNDIIVDVDVNKMIGQFLPPFMQYGQQSQSEMSASQQQQQTQQKPENSTQSQWEGWQFPQRFKGHFHPGCCHNHWPHFCHSGWGQHQCGNNEEKSKLDEQQAILQSFQSQKTPTQAPTEVTTTTNATPVNLQPQKGKEHEVIQVDEEMNEIGEGKNQKPKEKESSSDDAIIEDIPMEQPLQEKRQEENFEQPWPQQQQQQQSSSEQQRGFNFPWQNWWQQFAGQWGQQQNQRQLTEEQEIAMAIEESLREQEREEKRKKEQGEK